MNTTKKHNPGDTICTCRVGEDRYEIKRAGQNACGSILTGYTSCAFFDTDCNKHGLFDYCCKHDIYFFKIQPKEQL